MQQSGDGPTVRRLPGNPIVTPSMLPGIEGSNINGPSLILVPDWVTERLGRFYLYFAHHGGKYIRLAFADRPEGPWTIHQPGTLRLADAPGCRDHIASPDVHVDETRREFRIYFHGVVARGNEQKSFLARSEDGLRFTADPQPIADFYLRAIPWRGEWIGMAKGGVMYRSADGLSGFRELPPAFPMSGNGANGPGDVRHVALHAEGDTLWVYFTRIGDRPEQILRARIDLTQPSWRAADIVRILAPETQWEGAGLPLIPSRSGPARGRENAVRDPALCVHDRQTYMLYSVAGESGIAIAAFSSTGGR